MPNMQTHLVAAADLLASAEIVRQLPWLSSDPPGAAFLLGTISPDVRAVTGQPRESTHFFDIPLRDNRPVQVLLFEHWPQLQDASRLAPANAAFVAGYIAHLIMDVVWIEQIVMPGLYIEGEKWGTGHRNWRLYSILMTYLEYQAEDRVTEAMLDRMELALPEGGWLPFVEDHSLVKWRDEAGSLIRSGGARIVSRYFAISNHMEPDEMEAIVTSEARMAKEAYQTVPRKWLVGFQAETARRSEAAMLEYLVGVAT